MSKRPIASPITFMKDYRTLANQSCARSEITGIICGVVVITPWNNGERRRCDWLMERKDGGRDGQPLDFPLSVHQ